MKYQTKKQFVVVEAETGQEYQEKVNAYYSNPKYKGVVVDHRDRANFCAYITYEITEQIPETVKDAYELEGTTFTCSDCPYLERNPDKRVRHFRCMAAGASGEEWARRESPACAFFYEELQNGGLLEAMKGGQTE